MTARGDQITKWVKSLTKKELRKLTYQSIGLMIDSGYVCFHEDNLAPYWDGDGEPLVKGQQTHPDE